MKARHHGAHPFTRGTSVESNARYKQLIANGTTSLSVAFDLPTRMGQDSDRATAGGEVGKIGVAIDSIDDMRVLFGGIPLDKVSTSMAINAPAALLLLLYQLVAEEQGVPAEKLTGTIQNDVLTEYVTRGTYIFPPKPTLRLTADIFTYCKAEIPKWNTISISGSHLAEAGASPAQEIAFALASAIEYVRSAVAAGMDVDDFAPRLSFSFAARTAMAEEVATLRAVRRIWARVMREEFGARNPQSLLVRLHPQTDGAQLTAQQVLAYDTDVIEMMTDGMEAAACELMAHIEEMGGAVGAIDRGFQANEIECSAYRTAQETAVGEQGVVGVNRLRLDEEEPYEPLRVDPAIEVQQTERLCKVRAWRDSTRCDDALSRLKKASEGTDNVLYPMKDALAACATVGEVCDVLREVWGTYTPPRPSPPAVRRGDGTTCHQIRENGPSEQRTCAQDYSLRNAAVLFSAGIDNSHRAGEL